MILSRANRAVASILAVILVVTLVMAPAVFADDAKSGSAEVTFSLSGLDVNVKTALDLENGVFALTGSMGAGGQAFMEAGVYLGSALVVELTPFLETAVGVNLAELANNLPKSVFAPNSGSSFALDQKTYDSMLHGLESLISQSAPAQGMQVTAEQIEALVPHLSVALESLMQNADLKVEQVNYVVGVGEAEATQTTITIGPDALAATFGDILASIAADDNAMDAIGAIMDQLSAQGALQLPAGKTGAELLKEALADVDSLRQQLSEDANRSSNSIVISIFTAKDDDELMAIAVDLIDNSTSLSFVVFFANGHYGMWMINQKTQERVEINFTLTESSDEVLDWTFFVNNNTASSTQSANMSFHWDKVSGDFFFGIGSTEGISSTMHGNIQTTEDTAVITVTSIDDTDMSDLNLSIILRSNDPVTVPEYQDILTMSEDEIMQLFATAMSTIQGLSGIVA